MKKWMPVVVVAGLVVLGGCGDSDADDSASTVVEEPSQSTAVGAVESTTSSVAPTTGGDDGTATDAGSDTDDGPAIEIVVEGLQGARGSTVGPDGALYVTESAVRAVTRVDLATGETSPLVTGLPEPMAPPGGAVDVAFLDDTAYVLVTLAIGDSEEVPAGGLYRVEDDGSVTLVADIGQYSADNPPDTDFVVPTGVFYALQTHEGNLLITDGHHNRVLSVTPTGDITEVVAFGNVVPTGLAVVRDTVFMTQAGPMPHPAEVGKVWDITGPSPEPREVAAGVKLAVDVEPDGDGQVYVLAQGDHDGQEEGSPALPETGQLLVMGDDGTLTVVADGLDRPTSVVIIDGAAYVVSMAGQILRVDLP